MMRVPVLLLSLLLTFAKCGSPVTPESSFDSDIVLINIEDGDRAFIGKLLLKLDSLQPAVIGINVKFQARKKQDSILIDALKKIKNDVLVYNVNKDGSVNGSDSVLSALAGARGNLYYEVRLGLITTTVPLQKVNDSVHESFAFKIIKYWKPDFSSQIRVNEKIDIKYTRSLERFYVLNGSELIQTNIDNLELSNKVFLVGYAGPGNEDKHFTPLRRIAERKYESNEPDSYGLVIIANEIRTILEHKKED